MSDAAEIGIGRSKASVFGVREKRVVSVETAKAMASVSPEAIPELLTRISPSGKGLLRFLGDLPDGCTTEALRILVSLPQPSGLDIARIGRFLSIGPRHPAHVPDDALPALRQASRVHPELGARRIYSVEGLLGGPVDLDPDQPAPAAYLVRRDYEESPWMDSVGGFGAAAAFPRLPDAWLIPMLERFTEVEQLGVDALVDRSRNGHWIPKAVFDWFEYAHRGRDRNKLADLFGYIRAAEGAAPDTVGR